MMNAGTGNRAVLGAGVLTLPRLLGAIAALIPIAAFFVPRAIVPGLAVLCVTSIIGLRVEHRSIPLLPRRYLVALGAACIWAVVSAAWAIDAGDALFGAAKFAGNVLLGILFVQTVLALSIDERKVMTRFAAVGILAALAILATEAASGGPIYRVIFGIDARAHPELGPFWLNNTASILAVLSWPAAQVVQRSFGTIACALVIAVAGATSYLVSFEAGYVALACGAAVAVSIRIFGVRIAYPIAAAIVILNLSLPMFAVQFASPQQAAEQFPWLPNSSQHRLAIWTFTSERIVDHPLRGWGMDASRDMPGGKELLHYKDGRNIGDALPLHPHNAALQIWLELGIPGVIVYLGLIATLFHLIVRRSRSAPYAAGQLTTAIFIGSVSYGVWQAWWLATLWFSAAMMSAVVLCDSPNDS